MRRKITEQHILAFAQHLQSEEKAQNTIEKYLRDVRAFMIFAGEPPLEKSTVIVYKERLSECGYKARSVNSMLASLHSFFDFLGWTDLKVKTLKVQKQIFCDEKKEITKEEFRRLCHAAEAAHNQRLLMLLETICGTGIRVSEVPFITAEAVRAGEATVRLKGKTRTIFFVKDLQKKLLRYMAKQKIESGCVFITRSGKPICRSNIWREMKSICAAAKVEPGKVFPHNLRHLFARVFYALQRDIAKLADILGHSSIETTRIYIISSGAEHKRLMENMRLIV